MLFTLDRIEEKTVAVLIDDNGRKTDIPLSALGSDCRVGDVYELIDGSYIYNEKDLSLTGERNKKVYKIGDSVRVKVAAVNTALREIDFVLIQDGR